MCQGVIYQRATATGIASTHVSSVAVNAVFGGHILITLQQWRKIKLNVVIVDSTNLTSGIYRCQCWDVKLRGLKAHMVMADRVHKE